MIVGFSFPSKFLTFCNAGFYRTCVQVKYTQYTVVDKKKLTFCTRNNAVVRWENSDKLA